MHLNCAITCFSLKPIAKGNRKNGRNLKYTRRPRMMFLEEAGFVINPQQIVIKRKKNTTRYFSGIWRYLLKKNTKKKKINKAKEKKSIRMVAALLSNVESFKLPIKKT